MITANAMILHRPSLHSRAALTALCAVCFTVAGVALGAGAAEGSPLTVRERKIGDETAVVVSNDSYELVIRPRAGATISSLRFGSAERTECTDWVPGAPSGLLQEAHTADFPYELASKDVSEEAACLEFVGSSGPLHVRKMFRFLRGSPSFSLEVRFENHSQFSLSGPDAPAFCSLVLPGAGKQTGHEYYCLGGASGVRAITPATVLRELSPLRTSAGPVSWVAVTDPITRRGLGFVFLDGGASTMWAQRDRGGPVLVWWRYRPVPPGSALTTQLRLVPLDGFAAVSSLTPQFVADTVRSRAADGTVTMTLRLMAMEADLADVSIVTRAYGPNGSELEPCETLHYERLPAHRPETGRLRLPAGTPTPAWLQHEVYSQGVRVGHFVVPMSADSLPSTQLVPPLPEPRVEELGGNGAMPTAAPDEADQRRGFVVWRFEGQRAGTLRGPLDVTLYAGERETLFFAIRALAPIDSLRVSVVGWEDAARGVRPLHPAAAYLWSLREDPQGVAWLTPLVERKVAAGETVWTALTLDASPLGPGTYWTRLFVEGGAEPFEAPIQVAVSPRRLAPRKGFALWLVDAGGGESEAIGQAVSKLAAYTVSALTVRATEQAAAVGAPRALEAAEAGRLDMIGFDAPGRGTREAERVAAAWAGRAGLLCAPDPVWLLWSGTDEVRAVERLRAVGFAPAVAFPRLEGLDADRRWLRSAPDHWLVEGGCAKGVVPALLAAGKLQAQQAVWLLLDLRQADWRRAALEARSAFWAAAWQGFAGAAVLCPAATEQVDSQSVLRHILRDAREEAALAAEALHGGALLGGLSTAEGELALKQARLTGEIESLLGDRTDCLVGIETRRLPFREVQRAVVRGPLADAPLTGFQAAKARAVRILEGLDSVAPPKRLWDNLYWHGLPLLVDGQVRWTIWTGGIAALRATAENLQKGIEARCGEVVPIERQFPDLETPADGNGPLVVWVITDGGPASDLPSPVRAAGAACRGLCKVSLEGGTTAVLVPKDVDVEALLRTFLPTKTPYAPASAVR